MGKEGKLQSKDERNGEWPILSDCKFEFHLPPIEFKFYFEQNTSHQLLSIVPMNYQCLKRCLRIFLCLQIKSRIVGNEPP